MFVAVSEAGMEQIRWMEAGDESTCVPSRPPDLLGRLL